MSEFADFIKAELQILLSDLVEEDGTLKRSTDLKSDAGVAWHKVHAVYPTLSQERLVTMTPDQIIAKDPKIEKILQVPFFHVIHVLTFFPAAKLRTLSRRIPRHLPSKSRSISIPRTNIEARTKKRRRIRTQTLLLSGRSSARLMFVALRQLSPRVLFW
jgi:hypothetical protein